VPLHRAAVIEVDPPDGTTLLSIGDAAGDRAYLQHAAIQAPRPLIGTAHLLQFHPVARPIRRDTGDLLSAFKRRSLAYCLLPPLRMEATACRLQLTVEEPVAKRDRLLSSVVCRLSPLLWLCPPPTGFGSCPRLHETTAPSTRKARWPRSARRRRGRKGPANCRRDPDPIGHPLPALAWRGRRRVGALRGGSRSGASPLSSPWNR
jgi:hypothetical protein